MTTHAPPVAPPDEEAPKPVNPEPLHQPVDPEQRGTHPHPAPGHPPHDSEHPKVPTT